MVGWIVLLLILAIPCAEVALAAPGWQRIASFMLNGVLVLLLILFARNERQGE